MCLRRAPEKYIVGAALDRADLHVAEARFSVHKHKVIYIHVLYT
jgi:hypothetical protein